MRVTNTAVLSAILPALSVADAMLDVAALHDLEASTPEQHRELHDVLMQLEGQLGGFVLTLCAFSPVVQLSPALCELPESHGFQNAADDWVATVNVLAARKAWTSSRSGVWPWSVFRIVPRHGTG